MRSLKKILKDEKGVSVIMVAGAIVMIFGFAMVAIDLSLIQLAKTQLQNAADAAVLAGAMAHANEPGGQAEKEAAATAEAIRVAGLNVAVQDIDRPVVISAEDVTFPGSDIIRVTTHRKIDTGDPVTLYFLKVLDPSAENKGDVTATAAAKIFCVSGTDCLKPFCPPDRWDDRDNDSTWDPAEEFVDSSGNGVYDPGEPFTDDNENAVWDSAEFYDPQATGYWGESDIGAQITLKLNDAGKSPRMCYYYAVRYGPVGSDSICEGGDCYREWICPECEPWVIRIGDQLHMEPGRKVGPTNQGLKCLIDMDPTAQWVTGTVINSAYATSPRIIKAPVFDPTLGVELCHGLDCLTVVKIIVLFVEEHTGDEVVGRFMSLATEGVPDPDCSAGGFMYTVSLVE